MKKKKSSKKVSREKITPELPQNIIPVGERVFDDKNIYIHQKVYAQIHKFAAGKTENEHGGVLVGRILNEMGKENTIIEGFIEAKYNAATPTTLTFTHETWDHIHAEMDKKYKDKKIVGWIHTHPNFGVFLSENDKFIQENFFSDVNQVAYVVDPIQYEEGFFFWVDGKLERCPGFYLFDKNGVKIKQKAWEKGNDEFAEGVVVKSSKATNALIVVLILIMIGNMFITFNQNKRIQVLEKQVEDLNFVLQYAFLGTDVSMFAEDIRYQLELQKQAEQKAQEEAMKKSQEEGKAEQGEAEKAPETSEPAQKAEPETNKADKGA